VFLGRRLGRGDGALEEAWLLRVNGSRDRFASVMLVATPRRGAWQREVDRLGKESGSRVPRLAMRVRGASASGYLQGSNEDSHGGQLWVSREIWSWFRVSQVGKSRQLAGAVMEICI
jgi:hypothetical protein